MPLSHAANGRVSPRRSRRCESRGGWIGLLHGGGSGSGGGLINKELGDALRAKQISEVCLFGEVLGVPKNIGLLGFHCRHNICQKFRHVP